MGRTYDHQWDRLAKRHLRRHPDCAFHDCTFPARHVDHVVSVRVAPHRRLDPTNLQSLCQKHHNIVTAAYDKGSIRGACGADGLPLDPGHPWAQASGKAAIGAANARPRADPVLAARLKRIAMQGPRS